MAAKLVYECPICGLVSSGPQSCPACGTDDGPVSVPNTGANQSETDSSSEPIDLPFDLEGDTPSPSSSNLPFGLEEVPEAPAEVSLVLGLEGSPEENPSSPLAFGLDYMPDEADE